jgi:hypothetical protein
MKEGKRWSAMTEEQWKEERVRVRKIQDRHFQNGIRGEGE